MRDGHLEETLRRIIAEALIGSVKDPRVGFVTISEVRLNKDNSVAQVFYTVMGDEAERKKTLNGLKSCSGFLRTQIGEAIRLRTLPKLYFRYDDSLDRSFRLDEVLEELGPGAEDAAESSPPSNETTE